jgi:anti-anti-sigma regulatory factor
MSRTCGVVHHARDLAPGDHLCWPFDDRADLRVAVVEYFREGLAADEQLLFVGDGSRASLVQDLAALPAIGELLESGVVMVESTSSLYLTQGAIDADRRIDGYQSLARQAVVDGFRGLRVAADATALVRSADERRDFVRYEAAVDAKIASLPMLALCAYDIAALGAEAVCDLCSVHPLRHVSGDEPPGFSVHVTTGGAVAVEGEIESGDEERFERALMLATATAATHLRLDFAGLRFAGIRPVAALADILGVLRRTGRTVHVANVPPILHRCWEALGLEPLIDTTVPS